MNRTQNPRLYDIWVHKVVVIFNEKGGGGLRTISVILEKRGVCSNTNLHKRGGGGGGN